MGPELSPVDRVNNHVAAELRTIEGRLKTFVEAITEDVDQCKARKDIVEQLIWQTTPSLWEYIGRAITGQTREPKVE